MWLERSGDCRKVETRPSVSSQPFTTPDVFFSVRLDGTLERTDDYLSGWVGVAEGFKKYPV